VTSLYDVIIAPGLPKISAPGLAAAAPPKALAGSSPSSAHPELTYVAVARGANQHQLLSSGAVGDFIILRRTYTFVHSLSFAAGEAVMAASRPAKGVRHVKMASASIENTAWHLF